MFLSLRASPHPAIIDAATGAHVSFAELIGSGGEVAAHVGPEKALVFLLARNDSFTLTTYAGAIAAGHAVALLDGDAVPELTAELIRRYQPTWLAAGSDVGPQFATFDLPLERSDPVGGGWLLKTRYRPMPIHPDVALMLTTSGTTGSSKFVRLSIANIQANAASIVSYIGLAPDERPITSLPVYYSFGLSVVNSHWLAGAPVVLTSASVVQPEFWAAFQGHRCTSLAGVPFTYQLLERVGFRSMNLPAVRHLQQAGGRLDSAVVATYADLLASRDGRFFVMYGQTEATARMSYVPPDRLREKLGSVGIAIPGGRLAVDAEASGGDGPAVGEVVYEGPNVMLGYANSAADLALGDVTHGVLRTGDLGYLDGEGYLYLAGRSKRIAKVFGLRINLDEVEAALREHGPAAVIAGDDMILGFCEFGSGAEVEAVGRSLARRLKLHHSAVRLRPIVSIPKTSSGKIDYRKLEASIEG